MRTRLDRQAEAARAAWCRHHGTTFPTRWADLDPDTHRMWRKIAAAVVAVDVRRGTLGDVRAWWARLTRREGVT